MSDRYRNIARVKAIEKKNEQKLLAVNPTLDDESGIYFLTRVDEETGIKYSYVGQALHIKQRMLQHMVGYQHIDISLRKHGLYSIDNQSGWNINYKHFPQDQLNEKERYYITLYARNGYQSRNKDTGGGEGKAQIDEYRPAKGYRDGLIQGRKNLAKELSHIADKHLEIRLREGKEGNKVSQKALEKFMVLMTGEN